MFENVRKNQPTNFVLYSNLYGLKYFRCCFKKMIGQLIYQNVSKVKDSISNSTTKRKALQIEWEWSAQWSIGLERRNEENLFYFAIFVYKEIF